jgi:hypothetical protein
MAVGLSEHNALADRQVAEKLVIAVISARSHPFMAFEAAGASSSPISLPCQKMRPRGRSSKLAPDVDACRLDIDAGRLCGYALSVFKEFGLPETPPW